MTIVSVERNDRNIDNNRQDRLYKPTKIGHTEIVRLAWGKFRGQMRYTTPSGDLWLLDPSKRPDAWRPGFHLVKVVRQRTNNTTGMPMPVFDIEPVVADQQQITVIPVNLIMPNSLAVGQGEMAEQTGMRADYSAFERVTNAILYGGVVANKKRVRTKASRVDIKPVMQGRQPNQPRVRKYSKHSSARVQRLLTVGECASPSGEIVRI